jgi:hypothetical protein
LIALKIGPGTVEEPVRTHALRTEKLARLRSLTFHDLGLCAVATAGALCGLRELNLDGNGLDDQSAEMLAESANLSSVVRLGLGRNRLTDKGLATLAQSSNLPALRDLSLDSNPRIADSGIATLAASPLMSRLIRLGLQHTGFSKEGAEALIDSPHTERLLFLDLSRNVFGAATRKRLRQRFGGRVILDKAPGG